MARKRVTEIMERKILDPGTAASRRESFFHIEKALASSSCKHIGIMDLSDEPLQCLSHRVVDRDFAAFTALSLIEQDESMRQVHVLFPLQRQDFFLAHAGVE